MMTFGGGLIVGPVFDCFIALGVYLLARKNRTYPLK